MQVQPKYMNRSAILEKAVESVRKIHDAAIWVVKQSMPGVDYEFLPPFEIEWLKTEIGRLWNVEILREEVEYLWLKSVVGF
jgi:hypothetical protein